MNVTVLNFSPQITEHVSFPYVYALFKHYYQQKGDKTYTWIDPQYVTQDTDPRVVATWLSTLDLDYLLCSLYVWNYSYSHAVLQQYQQLCPTVTIAVGGPHVFPSTEYFAAHPWVSVCCDANTYGEVFVKDLLDGNALADITGAVWPHGRSTRPFIIREFEWATSPYSASLDLALDITQRYPYITMQLETSRGCPFRCSFCEWGGGIGTKMNKRALSNIKADIDAMVQSGVDTLQICDSNFGFWLEDIEVMQYICKYKKLTGIPKNLEIYGWSKNNIKHHYDILALMKSAGYTQHYAISLQSIREDTLANVRRSDVPVETRLSFARRVRDEIGLPIQFELMLALPGDTLNDYYQALDMRHEFQDFINFVWWVLPNTEAHTEEYRKQHGIITAWAETVESDYRDQKPVAWTANCNSWEYVIGTNTLTPGEWLEAFILDRFYIAAKNDSGAWQMLEHARLQLNLSPSEFWRRVINAIPLVQQGGWQQLWQSVYPKLQELIVPASTNKSLYVIDDQYSLPELALEYYERGIEEIIQRVSNV
jgi:tRNA A37 methylthiotransferase MiaB